MVSECQILGSNNFQYPTPLSDPTILLQCKIHQKFDVTGSDIVIYQIWERDDNTFYYPNEKAEKPYHDLIGLDVVNHYW